MAIRVGSALGQQNCGQQNGSVQVAVERRAGRLHFSDQILLMLSSRFSFGGYFWARFAALFRFCFGFPF